MQELDNEEDIGLTVIVEMVASDEEFVGDLLAENENRWLFE
jgi:hypothetical protein